MEYTTTLAGWGIKGEGRPTRPWLECTSPLSPDEVGHQRTITLGIRGKEDPPLGTPCGWKLELQGWKISLPREQSGLEVSLAQALVFVPRELHGWMVEEHAAVLEIARGSAQRPLKSPLDNAPGREQVDEGVSWFRDAARLMRELDDVPLRELWAVAPATVEKLGVPSYREREIASFRRK